MISPQLHLQLARARAEELRRAAGSRASAQRPVESRARTLAQRNVTLRLGVPGDERRLARLAELDSAEPLPRPVLLADVDGQLLAALALTDGAVVANPFHPTAELVELLRARAYQLRRKGGMRGRRLHSSPWRVTRLYGARRGY